MKNKLKSTERVESTTHGFRRNNNPNLSGEANVIGICCWLFLGAVGVTLSVFSGVPDPHWIIQPTAEILNEYKKAEKAEALLKVDAMPSRLGYRGIIMQQDNTEVLVLGPKTTDLQLLLLLTMPSGKIPNKVYNRVFGEIKAGNILPVEERRKRYVPPYNPVPWASPVKEKNNCYNYANVKITNTFAQPGRGSGAIYAAITKARILAAAVNDGLVAVANGNSPAGSRHVVALVVEDCK